MFLLSKYMTLSTRFCENKIKEEIFHASTIDVLPTYWDTFLTVVNGREEHPNFKIIWHDCIQT